MDNRSPVHSARTFWKNHLRRLKFHNPALPITVDYTSASPTDPVILTLQFEHKDPEVLQKIAGNIANKVKKTPRPQKLVPDEMSETEKEILARQQSPNFRNAPVSWKSKEEEAEALHQAAVDAEASADKTAEEGPTDVDPSTLPSDAVVPSPLSATAKGAPTLYTRTVTLGLRNRSPAEIWDWFSNNTRCTNVPKSAADSREEAELAVFFKQSDIDRQRVKEGREAVRKEKADLQRARGEADKLKAEAL